MTPAASLAGISRSRTRGRRRRCSASRRPTGCAAEGLGLGRGNAGAGSRRADAHAGSACSHDGTRRCPASALVVIVCCNTCRTGPGLPHQGRPCQVRVRAFPAHAPCHPLGATQQHGQGPNPSHLLHRRQRRRREHWHYLDCAARVGHPEHHYRRAGGRGWKIMGLIYGRHRLERAYPFTRHASYSARFCLQ